jgi:hypothetical protein
VRAGEQVVSELRGINGSPIGARNQHDVILAFRCTRGPHAAGPLFS